MAAAPRLRETKRRLDPVTGEETVEEFDIELCGVTDRAVVGKYVAGQGDPYGMSEGSVSFGVWWHGENLGAYRVHSPDGKVLRYRFDVLDDLTISEGAVSFRDLLLDCAVTPGSFDVELMDEDEVELACENGTLSAEQQHVVELCRARFVGDASALVDMVDVELALVMDDVDGGQHMQVQAAQKQASWAEIQQMRGGRKPKQGPGLFVLGLGTALAWWYVWQRQNQEAIHHEPSAPGGFNNGPELSEFESGAFEGTSVSPESTALRRMRKNQSSAATAASVEDVPVEDMKAQSSGNAEGGPRVWNQLPRGVSVKDLEIVDIDTFIDPNRISYIRSADDGGVAPPEDLQAMSKDPRKKRYKRYSQDTRG